MNKNKPDLEDDNPFAKKIYFMPFFPMFFGFLFAVGPVWSTFYGTIWGGIILLIIIWSVYGYYLNRHHSVRWRAMYGVINADIGAFFCLMPFWRTLGEPLWLLFVLVFLYFACMIFVHLNSRTILQGIVDPQNSRFGKIFWFGMIVFLVLTGGGSYGFAKYLEVFYGKDVSGIVLSSCIMAFSFIFLFCFHSAWSRVKDPTFIPGNQRQNENKK